MSNLRNIFKKMQVFGMRKEAEEFAAIASIEVTAKDRVIVKDKDVGTITELMNRINNELNYKINTLQESFVNFSNQSEEFSASSEEVSAAAFEQSTAMKVLSSGVDELKSLSQRLNEISKEFKLQ